jgi:hypothetical protein
LKQRLPLISTKPNAASRIEHVASEPAARVSIARPLLCVANPAIDSGGLGFARSFAGAVRARGRPVAAWALESDAGSKRALAALDAMSIELDPQADWCNALGRAADALPRDSIVIALGRTPAARLRAWLTVEVASASRMRAAETQTASSIDLYVGRDADRVAVLIAAWLALDSSIIRHTEARRSP